MLAQVAIPPTGDKRAVDYGAVAVALDRAQRLRHAIVVGTKGPSYRADLVLGPVDVGGT